MPTITDSIGRVLAGRYRIESALGSGASAHVFGAWDTSLRRRVAIKVLHPALAGDSAFLRRFRAEAQAAASLTHPHVLAVHDWGDDETGPFLVLELCAGGSLRHVLDDGRRLIVAQALAVGTQAAEGLAYAHARGFVHRDVKPANLLFGEEGRLRVADFGLARALAEAAWTEPAGATLGTARYAAPEQAQGRTVTGAADVYSLALVLYEAVTGVVPFTTDTTLGTLMARVGARLPGHDALGPLAPMLDAATSEDPDRRLDASSLAARLRALAGEMPDPEPLSLPGLARHDAAGGVDGGRWAPAGDDADATELGIEAADSGAPSSAPAPGAAGGAIGAAVLAAADKGAAQPASGHLRTGVDQVRRRLRRLPLRVTALVVLLLAAVGGAAYGVDASQVLVASHRLPVVTGDTTRQATSALRGDHFGLQVIGHRFSVAVPAGHIVLQSPAAGTSLKEGTTVRVVLSAGPPPVTVPSLSSVTGGCAQATSVLATAGLHAACTSQSSTSVGSGSVISWSPRASAPLGSSVQVVISSGPPIETVPNLSGSTCQGATTALQAVGLVAQCTQVYSTTVASGQVVSWSPQGHAPEGATVTVQVSQGPPPVVVPSIYGHTVSEAIQMLEAAGLVPGTDQGSVAGKVVASSPPEGATVPEGTTVNMLSS